MLRDVPVFGHVAASQRLWTVNFSPSYFGQGITTGLPVLLIMLAGAVVGWGILSPIAKFQGWAPGPVADWDSGSRGWIIWVSLSIMLADAMVRLVAFSIRLLWPNSHRVEGNSPLGHAQSGAEPSETLPATLSNLWFLLGLIVSALICLASVKIGFGGTVSNSTALLSIFVALPLCLIGINAVGSTDHSPASGIAKISQILVGALVHRGNANVMVENLVAGGIAEAGVVTAGFLMQTFKTAHLVDASPARMLFGMIYGNIPGGVIASSLYKLYATVYTIPGQVFGIPSAYVWRAGARLAIGQDLPPKVPEFGLIMGVCFAFFSLVRILLPAIDGLSTCHQESPLLLVSPQHPPRGRGLAR